MLLEQMRLEQIPYEQMSSGQMSYGQMSYGQMSLNKYHYKNLNTKFLKYLANVTGTNVIRSMVIWSNVVQGVF